MSTRQKITPVGQSLSARIAKLEATSIQQANVINLLTLRLRDVYQAVQGSQVVEPTQTPLILTPEIVRGMDEASKLELGQRGFPVDLLHAELDAAGG